MSCLAFKDLSATIRRDGHSLWAIYSLKCVRCSASVEQNSTPR
jgi:hypothetical protein